MRVAAVESTTLLTVSYDEAQALLQLEFCSGAVYQYFSVPAEVHQTLLAAPSKGRYFNQAIRGRCPYRLISDFEATPRRAEISARCGRCGELHGTHLGGVAGRQPDHGLH